MFIEHRGMKVPTMLYGTAWKEERTEALTKLALATGFAGIDTANQRRHYYEAGVGEALRHVCADGRIKRSDLFLQTKFTFAAGQDHRLPYDPKAGYAAQVQQSFASSLEHLHIDYLDSYVLHGPLTHHGLVSADWEAWHAMEELQQAGNVKLIGISNVSAEQLQQLLDKARIAPAFVQNRCYARMAWDEEVRRLCRANDIRYQGFSLLTANSAELNQPDVHAIAKRLGCSVARVVFRFAMQVGMIPLTGTSSEAHMREDLAAHEIELTPEEVETIEYIAYRP